MKRFSKKQTKSLLSKLYRDVEVNPDDLFRLLTGKINKIGAIDQSNLFYRMLTSYDWYTIMKIIPQKELNNLLVDDILNRIYPRDLRDKYLYARSVISR